MNKIYVLLMILILSSCKDPSENKKVIVVKTINEIECDSTINVSKKLSLYDKILFVKSGFEIEPILTKNELYVKSFAGERSSSTNDKLIILFENNKRIILFNYNKNNHYESFFKLSLQNINDLSKFKVKKIQYCTNFDNGLVYKQTFNVDDNSYFMNVYSDFLNKKIVINKI